MHLLNLTLQPATAVSAATVGSFSGTKGQEILVVRGGTRLEMLKLNTSSGHCESYFSVRVERGVERHEEGWGMIEVGCRCYRR